MLSNQHITHTGDIEIIDFIEQVTAQYPPQLAFAIGNAIKYLSRAPLKNGHEDLAKAKFLCPKSI
ncbi:phage protein [Staphylococcus aureus]|nr:phage protein [Staphylococcus aureus]